MIWKYHYVYICNVQICTFVPSYTVCTWTFGNRYGRKNVVLPEKLRTFEGTKVPSKVVR